jgi:hypothetical protein
MFSLEAGCRPSSYLYIWSHSLENRLSNARMGIGLPERVDHFLDRDLSSVNRVCNNTNSSKGFV